MLKKPTKKVFLLLTILLTFCTFNAWAVVKPHQKIPHSIVNKVAAMLQHQDSQIMGSLLALQKQVQNIQIQDGNTINGLSYKINLLQKNNQILVNEVAQTRQKMQAMDLQLAALTTQAQKPSWQQHIGTVLVSLSQRAQQMLGGLGFKLITGLITIFLLWTLWSVLSRSKKSSNKEGNSPQEMDRKPLAVADLEQDNSADDTEGDYDFLQTSEAIPTKIDLARAYIAMDNNSAARLVLQEVIAQGNAEQQQLAKELYAGLEADVT